MKIKSFKKYFLSVMGLLFLGIIGSLIAGALSPWFNNILGSIFGFIKHNFLDIIYVVLIGIILFILFLHSRRFKSLSTDRFNEMDADNKRMQSHNNQLVEQMNKYISANEKFSKEYREIIEKLKPIIDVIPHTDIITENNAVWVMNKKDSHKEGPYCIRCYSSDKRTIRMLDSKTVFKCPVCSLIIKKEAEGLSAEQIFILESLASKPERGENSRSLEHEYTVKLGKDRLSLNLNLNLLIEIHYIEQIECGTGYDEIGYEIKPEGMKYLSEYKKKSE